MSRNIQMTTENLASSPKLIADSKDKALAIGDLHGNAMKGIYFLIRYGVMKLKNPKEDYDTLWNIYNTKTSELTLAQLTQFQTILTNASITSPKLITFIGDELSDRGQNDWFTLLLMKKLHDNRVPYQIQLSNHSSVALQSFSINRPLPGVIGHTNNNQQCSLDNMWELVKKGLITREDVRAFANEFYKPHLRIIGYTKTTSNHITLYTHAPVGLETVRNLSKKFGVKYDDSTIDRLIFCIDEINRKASESIMKNDFQKYHDVTHRNATDPLNRLFWSRELQSDFTLKPTTDAFKVELVHGHIGPDNNLNAGLKNMDSHWGMLPGDEIGNCVVFCETAGPGFNCSLDENQQDNILNILIEASEKYLTHLQYSAPSDLRTKKIDILNDTVDALKKKGLSANQKIAEFNEIILNNPANKAILGTKRDNAAKKFFKVVAVALVSIASFGYLASDIYQRFFGEKAMSDGKKFILDITKYKQSLSNIKNEGSSKMEEAENMPSGQVKK